MPSTLTPNIGLKKPADGDTNWGTDIRDSLDTLDALFPGGQAAIADGSLPIGKLDTDIATQAELSPVASLAASASADAGTALTNAAAAAAAAAAVASDLADHEAVIAASGTPGHVDLDTITGLIDAAEFTPGAGSITEAMLDFDPATQAEIDALTAADVDAAPLVHTHGRADIPAEIAYEDEVNIYTQTQFMSGGTSLGLTTTTDVRTRDMYVGRRSNISDVIFLDYQDELALFTRKTGRSATITPTPSSGSASVMFEDNSTCVIYNNGTSPWPIVIEMDASGNEIQSANSSQFRVGLTLRNTGAPTPYPTDFVLEQYSSGAYTTVLTGTIVMVNGVALLPTFTSIQANSNINKLRLTLNGANPISGTGVLRIQRVILYHQTADWNPWALHRLLGGDVYGAVTMKAAVTHEATVTNGGAVTNSSTVTTTGKATFNGGTAGLRRIFGGWPTLGVPVVGTVAAPVYTADADMTITGIEGYAGTAGGGTSTFDIERRPFGSGTWSSIFSVQPTFASGSDVPTSGTLSTTSITAGDKFRLKWITVNATLADVTIQLKGTTR